MKPWIKQIRELMRERGMTQEALATELGRGQSWLNHKLSGRRKVNVDDIVLIAQALDIDPAALLSNVTNYDRLAENFLGVAEANADYQVQSLGDLDAKLRLLEPEESSRFLHRVEAELDELLAKKTD